MNTPQLYPQTIVAIAVGAWSLNALVALALAVHPSAPEWVSSFGCFAALGCIGRVIWLARS